MEIVPAGGEPDLNGGFGGARPREGEGMFEGAGLQDLQLEIHDVAWKSETLDPIVRGFWDFGNMAALPPDVQDRIKESTRENAKPYEKDGRYEFPHSVLLGRATKP